MRTVSLVKDAKHLRFFISSLEKFYLICPTYEYNAINIVLLEKKLLVHVYFKARAHLSIISPLTSVTTNNTLSFTTCQPCWSSTPRIPKNPPPLTIDFLLSIHSTLYFYDVSSLAFHDIIVTTAGNSVKPIWQQCEV
jgi:hypothetical protein